MGISDWFAKRKRQPFAPASKISWEQNKGICYAMAQQNLEKHRLLDHVQMLTVHPWFTHSLEDLIASQALRELSENTYHQEFGAMMAYLQGKGELIGYSGIKDCIYPDGIFTSSSGTILTPTIKLPMTFALPEKFDALAHYHSHPEYIPIPSHDDILVWRELAFAIAPKPLYPIIYGQFSKQCFWFSVVP